VSDALNPFGSQIYTHTHIYIYKSVGGHIGISVHLFVINTAHTASVNFTRYMIPELNYLVIIITFFHAILYKTHHVRTLLSTKSVNWLTRFALEEKLICTGAFLSVSLAFVKIWHSNLLYKWKLLLSSHYYLILKHYLEDCFLSVCSGFTFSPPTEIKTDVP
jgi:hypothetical protein